MLPPHANATDIDAIAERAARLSCVDERFAEFAAACGVECGPLTGTDRDRLIVEIDALVARAYGLEAPDLEMIFDDFTHNAVPESRRQAVRDAFKDLA